MERNVYRVLRWQPIALYIHMKHTSSCSEVYGICINKRTFLWKQMSLHCELFISLLKMGHN